MSNELDVTPELVRSIFKLCKKEDLMEFLLEEDIKILCEQKAIKIPQVLIWLLCNVSQELWLDKKQFIVKLENLPNSEELNSLYLNKNDYTYNDFFFEKGGANNQFELNVNDDGKIYYPVFEKYMFQITTNDYIYLGQGPVLGKILTKNDEPYKWTFKHNNLEELLISFLKEEYDNFMK